MSYEVECLLCGMLSNREICDDCIHIIRDTPLYIDILNLTRDDRKIDALSLKRSEMPLVFSHLKKTLRDKLNNYGFMCFSINIGIGDYRIYVLRYLKRVARIYINLRWGEISIECFSEKHNEFFKKVLTYLSEITNIKASDYEESFAYKELNIQWRESDAI